MRIRREEADVYIPSEADMWGNESEESLSHRKLIRKRLEEKLESRRLKHEIDDYDEDYDWHDPDRV